MKVIIVGGGIVGASCALEAASRGGEVILVDAAIDGRATAAGAGIISPWSARRKDPAWQEFANAAAREYPALVERLARSGKEGAGASAAGAEEAEEEVAGYRKVGALYLCPDQETTSDVYGHLRRQTASAPEMGTVTVLSGPSARELFPPLRDDMAAVHVPGAARVDGRLMTAALTRAAVAHGTEVRHGTARLLRRDSPTGGASVPGVAIGGEIIESDAVVVAAGAWTSELVTDAGLTDADLRKDGLTDAGPENPGRPADAALWGIAPQRGQIAHIGLPGTDTRDWPVVRPAETGHYLLAFGDSRVVAGATRETGSGFDYRVTPGGLAEVLNEALRIAPGLSGGSHLETRIGFRPASPDGRPLLGAVRGIDRLVIAAGLGAEGLTLGPRTGALAARVALGLDPGPDLSPFDPLRPVSRGGDQPAAPTDPARSR
jgi:D-amino-acid dehydrogenase